MEAYNGSIVSGKSNTFTQSTLYNGYWYLSNGVLTSGLPISAPSIYVSTPNTPGTSQPSAAWTNNNGTLTTTLPIFVNSVNASSSSSTTSNTNYWFYTNNGTALYTSYPISINSFTPSP